MVLIYSNGEKITYTAGDTFLMEVSSDEGFDEGAQLKLQIAESETAPLIVDATFSQINGGFAVTLSEREKEKLTLGNYIYKLVLVSIAGEIITQKSGDLIVKWGV